MISAAPSADGIGFLQLAGYVGNEAPLTYIRGTTGVEFPLSCIEI